jgi:hypothetical protein
MPADMYTYTRYRGLYRIVVGGEDEIDLALRAAKPLVTGIDRFSDGSERLIEFQWDQRGSLFEKPTLVIFEMAGVVLESRQIDQLCECGAVLSRTSSSSDLAIQRGPLIDELPQSDVEGIGRRRKCFSCEKTYDELELQSTSAGPG